MEMIEVDLKGKFRWFETFRRSELPKITALAAVRPDKYQALLSLSEKWQPLYADNEGLLQFDFRELDPVLRQKQTDVVVQLLHISNDFLKEFERLWP